METNTQNQNPLPPSHPYSRRWLWIILGSLFIVAIFTLVSFFVFSKSYTPIWGPFKEASYEDLYGMEAPSDPSVSLETDGWQTYRNEGYGFEVMYPHSWKITEDVIIGSPDAKGISISEPRGNGQKWGVVFYNFEGRNISNDEFKSLSILKNSDYEFDPVETLIIGGISAELYVVKDPSDVQMGYPIDLTLKKDGKVINISGFFDDFYGGNKQEFVFIFKQILSTFKFIEPSDISGWQTYRNEGYGFEFRYPNDVEVGGRQESVNLGAYNNPVYGMEIANNALVVLNTQKLKDSAQNILSHVKGYLDAPREVPEGEIPFPECELQAISNEKLSIEAIYCVGPAYYVYITGHNFDLFYDGFPARFLEVETLNQIFSTFKLIE